MKHRNDENKFIFAEYKKLEVKRLYKKLNEISQRKNNMYGSLGKSQFRQTDRIMRIPKNQDEVRRYEILMENRRLVDRLSTAKSTVWPHIVTPRKNRTIQFKQILRNREINEENERLAKVISQISLIGRNISD